MTPIAKTNQPAKVSGYLRRYAAAAQMTTWTDRDKWFPFVEDDNAAITGPGHQDPDRFVAEVYAYDCAQAGEENAERHNLSDVTHQWIKVRVEDITDPEDWYGETCDPDDPEAVAVTTIWNVR